jgi:hypothetical protein
VGSGGIQGEVVDKFDVGQEITQSYFGYWRNNQANKISQISNRSSKIS